MTHDVVLGLHHLWEALDAERLGVVGVDEQDVRAGRDRVRRLHVERDLERPRALVLEVRAVAGLRHGRRRAVHRQLAELRHAGDAGHAFFAAHRPHAEGLVEHVKVVRHRVASVGVDDRDGDALAVQALRVERPDVVRGLDRLGREAGPRDGLALRLRRRRGAAGDELVVGDRRVRRGQRRRYRRGRADGRRHHEPDHEERGGVSER